MALAPVGRVSAWGPQRDPISMKNPADHAMFNTIGDNNVIGDERNFVRVVEAGSGKTYGDNVEIEPGKQYRVMIYYHNNASSTYNTEEYGHRGVARDVRVASQFPASLKKGEKGTVVGIITSTNAVPNKVWDEAYFTAKKDVNLSYVTGSAIINNQWEANGRVLSTNLFSSTGTFVGLNELNGVILGCSEYSGQVTYTVLATAVEPEPEIDPDPDPQPDPEPDPEPTPDDPDPTPTPEPTPDPTPDEPTPEVLPDTGPAEIILASVVVAALLAGGIYLVVSGRKLKKVEKDVMGK